MAQEKNPRKSSSDDEDEQDDKVSVCRCTDRRQAYCNSNSYHELVTGSDLLSCKSCEIFYEETCSTLLRKLISAIIFVLDRLILLRIMSSLSH